LASRVLHLLKWAPYGLLAVGAALLGCGIIIGVKSDDAPQLAYIMDVAGVLLLAFGLTLYLFTEGVAGRRTGN
jgi:hypothetical protein